VFGDVHLLSQFLGASGRAYLLRLEEAERARVNLARQLEQRQFRTAKTSAQAARRIRELEEELARTRRWSIEPSEIQALKRQLGLVERPITT
jgi:polyhydroxyalkanoate synthesis regulator phasin